MLFFDSVMLATTLAWILVWAMRSRWSTRWRSVVLTTLVLATLAHLTLEGFRWQMVPANAGVAFVLINRAVHARDWLANTLVAAAGVSAILSLTASVAFPVFTLPDPSGPHPIGTAEHHLVDPSRGEDYSAAPDDHRELMLRVWYPSEAPTGEAEPRRGLTEPGSDEHDAPPLVHIHSSRPDDHP